MASTSNYENVDSTVDDIISIVRRCHLGLRVDELFLHDLKSLIKNKMRPRLMKPAVVNSVLKTELKCLPLPNEILVKIFGYLNIQDISRSAQVSHQFNMISKDSSLWQTWGKLSIDGMKVPTEFLTYIIQKGITELSLFQCEILPPREKMTELKGPLLLKTLSFDETDMSPCPLYNANRRGWTKGDRTLLNHILISHPMEKIDFREEISPEYSEIDISQFIKVLPQIGSQLKSLNLGWGLLGKLCDLSSISSIVNTCLDLEELNISGNRLNEEAISYLCENLTSNILKLDIGFGGWHDPDTGLNDNNIKALVKRCPKLKVLDIRSNENVTYQGLVAIIEDLPSLEYLGLPDSIGEELGLPNDIDYVKIGRLKSLEKLKELSIGDLNNSLHEEYQSILEIEMPHLKKYNDDDSRQFEVAEINTEEFKSVTFCPNCHECDKYLVLRC